MISTMKAIQIIIAILMCSLLCSATHSQTPDLSQLVSYNGKVGKVTNQQDYNAFSAAHDIEMQKEIDFAQQLIRYGESCRYCSSCPPENQGCHANACQFKMFHFVTNRIENVEYDLIPLSYLMLTDVEQGEVIDTKEKFAQTLAVNPELKDMAIQVDFDKEILIYGHSGGDCHATFTHQLQYDHSQEILRWTINNTYGGCRAGGIGVFLLKTKKPKPSYLVDVKEVMITDRGDKVDSIVKNWNDEALVGEWKLVSFEGKPVDASNKDLSNTTWIFTTDRFKMVVRDKVFKGTYFTKQKETPKQMELTLEGEDKGAAAIYKFEDGKLIIKLNDSGDEGYATDFEPASRYDVYEFIKVQ